jgi:hypothetical protein
VRNTLKDVEDSTAELDYAFILVIRGLTELCSYYKEWLCSNPLVHGNERCLNQSGNFNNPLHSLQLIAGLLQENESS